MRLIGRRVLITGGAGFLGSHLVEYLLSEGAKVRVLDVFASGRETNISGFNDQIELFNCSTGCADLVSRAAAGVDTIIHLAFPMELRQNPPKTELIADHFSGFFNLVESALDNNALFIYISSIAVYGNERYVPVDEDHPLAPVLIHGAIKLSNEIFCSSMAKTHGLRSVVLRVADIYGPRNTRISVPIKFLLQAMHNQPLTVYGDGSDSRTYTFVADFNKAVVLSMIRPEAEGMVFNLAGDDCISMSELADVVNQVTGRSCPVVFQESPQSGRRLAIDNRRLKKAVGFKPSYSITEGLNITYQWLQENPGYYLPGCEK